MRLSLIRNRPVPLKPSKSREKMEVHARMFWSVAQDMVNGENKSSIDNRIKFWTELGPPPNLEKRWGELSKRNEARV